MRVHATIRATLLVLLPLYWLSAALGAGISSTSNQLPRKVIVGTTIVPFWGKQPPLEVRLHELTAIVDRMQAASEKKYGRGVDLAILPEMAVTGEGESVGTVLNWSYPLAGPLHDTFAAEARKCHCYIIAPSYLQEGPAPPRCSNAAILFDRNGNVVGIYRKVHLVVDGDGKTLEHGSAPGKDEPVFQCDFGKIGIQICYDMDFDSGWRELSRRGAELVAWPSQSPQTSQPGARAREGHFYIVSSTWRNNASVFEPTGKIVSQIKWNGPEGLAEAGKLTAPAINILVQELDLSYALLGWARALKNGEGLRARFGNKVGYRYYEDEDCGMFWSNDPHMTIRQMYTSLGLEELQDEYRHAEDVYHQDGVPGY